MKMIVDTREQLPLDFFFSDLITDVIYTKLLVGDYSCEFKGGYVPPVVFERKSLSDLFGTLTQGYDRFKKELERAKEVGIEIKLIVEGTLTHVEYGIVHSTRDGNSVVKQMFTLWVKYGLQPIFCADRYEVSRYIIHYFSAIGRKAVADIKEGLKGKKADGKSPIQNLHRGRTTETG